MKLFILMFFYFLIGYCYFGNYYIIQSDKLFIKSKQNWFKLQNICI
jgi:hypothetical protein